jgi:hypothetical protein
MCVLTRGHKYTGIMYYIIDSSACDVTPKWLMNRTRFGLTRMLLRCHEFVNPQRRIICLNRIDPKIGFELIYF